jgi:hypothetical protein
MADRILTSSVGLNVSKKDGIVYLTINLDENFDLSNIKILAKLGDTVVFRSTTNISSEKIQALLDNNEGGITKPKR